MTVELSINRRNQFISVYNTIIHYMIVKFSVPYILYTTDNTIATLIILHIQTFLIHKH